MEDSKPKELKTIYIHEAAALKDNEIDLVDLALLLLKRKNIIGGVAILFTLVGLAFALLTPKQITITSSITIGSQLINNEFRLFESTDTLAAKAEHSFIPNVLNQHYASRMSSDEARFNIKAIIPKKSNILLIKAQCSETEAALLKDLLGQVNQSIIEDHAFIYDALKQNLTSEMDLLREQLAQSGKTPTEKIDARYLQLKLDDLQRQLGNLRPTREILPPIIYDTVVGVSRRLIVSLSFTAGLFFGVFTALFAEFVKKVREKQQEADLGKRC